MSLVIEALRRVEKTDARTGSIGASVASYRPPARPRSSLVPLLLGVLTGGALVSLLSPQGAKAPADARAGEEPSLPTRPKGAAGLPPPLILGPAATPVEPRLAAVAADDASTPAPVERRPLSPPALTTPALVLQAISERDGRPIAMISDQLVREGDKLGRIRVTRIGSESVEVLLENGQYDTVRFAPPPPPEPSPSPSPDPRL